MEEKIVSCLFMFKDIKPSPPNNRMQSDQQIATRFANR